MPFNGPRWRSGHRTAGAQELSLDRRLYPGVALDVPGEVDHQGGVRRGGAEPRAPQVLLVPACALSELVARHSLANSASDREARELVQGTAAPRRIQEQEQLAAAREWVVMSV